MSEWILRTDGALCLPEYPIRIKRGGKLTFELVSDWHGRVKCYHTLALAKLEGEYWAREIDEFSSAKLEKAK